MLDPSEVVYGECHLTVYSPDYTCVHCDTEDFVIDYMSVFSEGLVEDGVGCEEEDDYGAENSI